MRGRRILSLGLGAMLLGSGLVAGPQVAGAVGAEEVTPGAVTSQGLPDDLDRSRITRSAIARESMPELLGGDYTRGFSDAEGRAFTGKGQIVVVIDGAFNPQHPMLQGKVIDEACFFGDSVWTLKSGEKVPAKNLCGASSRPWVLDPAVQILTGPGSSAVSKDLENAVCVQEREGDLPPWEHFCHNAHGTAVASAVAGNPYTYAPTDERHAGVAAGAELIVLKIGDQVGWNNPAVRAALRYVDEVLVPKYPGRIAAVNLSASGGDAGSGSCEANFLGETAAKLKRKNVAVTVASGNEGHTSMVGTWSCAEGLVRVGATGIKDLNTLTTKEKVATNASTTNHLLAPVGSGALDDQTNLAWNIPSPAEPHLEGQYGPMAGTSFAAPQVAGAFAVLREKFGYSKTVDELVALMRETGVPVADQRPGNTGVVTPRLWLADAIGKRATPAHDFTGNGKAEFVFTGVDTSIPMKMTEIDLDADWVGGHDTHLVTGWDWKAHSRIVPVHDYDAPNTNGVITVTGDRLLYHRYNRATNAFAAPQTILATGASGLRGLTFASQLPHPTTGSGRAVVMVMADGSLVARAKDAYGVGLGAERILLTSMDPVGTRSGTKSVESASSDTSADGTGQRSATTRSASKDAGSGTADSGADGSGPGTRVEKSLAGVSRLVAVTDVNGDGNPDLVTREPDTGAPMVRWGTGNPVTPFQTKTQALSEKTYWGDKEQMFVFPATGTTPAHLGYRAPTTGALLHFPFERSGTSWRVSPDYRQSGNWNNTANFRLAPEK
ncbi:hypothetical protein BV502_10425 [Leucobacter sp. OAMLP11]|uniref:S8/S53 family peptidase n=3 Tax=Leucobacter TaxID=55968 RepID=UPI000C19B390|nr:MULTISPECIES: S8/S53 family peptidase [unclassified Leucobacter]PIO49384.1 hypothetical protein BV502_10425 [Leucobacter sp. OAMLP11]